MATTESAAPTLRAGRVQANQNDRGNRGLGFELEVQSGADSNPGVHRMVLPAVCGAFYLILCPEP